MRFSIIIFLSVLLFNACKTGGNNNGSSNVVKLSKDNAEYTILKKGNGKSSTPGDYIQFSLVLKGDKGNTIVERLTEDRWATEVIKDVDSTTIPILEMLYSLSEGDSVMMAKPMEGDKRPQGLENVDTLIYFIKAEKILTQEEMDTKTEALRAEQDKKLEGAKVVESKVGGMVSSTLSDYKAGKLAKKITKTENGVGIYFNEKGKGAKVEKGNKLEVAYYGVLKADGKMFDNSFGRGQDLPFSAGMGQMIKGWDEAMLYMHEGDKATIFIPYNLAYGEAGRPGIPAKSDLVFYIEVHKVQK